jgi:hypothetical protein
MKLIKFALLFFVTNYSSAQVVINEFMASNTTIIKDNAGEYDDWVELYNNGNVDVDISAWSMTDSIGDLRKYKFKRPTVIPAKGYKIFWADEDSSQGNTFHMNFKLSSLGEMIVLVDSLKVIRDSITYGKQVTDKSMARVPNGTGPFVMGTPTFNASNGGTSAIYSVEGKSVFRYLSGEKSIVLMKRGEGDKEYRVFDGWGRIVLKGDITENKIPLNSLSYGMYWLATETKQFSFIVQE